MATFTVRNVPEDAKHRFRQVAAAHGRSMEEHLRHLVVEAEFGAPSVSHVADAPPTFRHATRVGEDVVRELLRVANGTGQNGPDAAQYAEIRFMTAKDAMAELRRLANGVGLDLPPRLSTELEAPGF